MPDLQEVFRMATEKVRQDPGALDRQVTKRRKAARNRRVGAFATVLVLIAAVVGAYAFTRGGTRDMPANHTSITPSIPIVTASSLVDLRTGEITPLPASIATATSYAVSPDHSMVAYSACCDQPVPLYVANIDGTGVRQMSAEGQDAFGVLWSPDGSRLVYQQRDASTKELGNLVVQNVATGQRTQITNFDQTQKWRWWFTFPSFFLGGRSILYQLPSGDPSNPIWDLWVVPATGGTSILVRRDAGWGGFAYGRANPKRDFAYLSPVSNRDFTGKRLWILKSWDLRRVTPRVMVPDGHLKWLRWSPDGTRISYWDSGSIYVLDVATGSTREVAEGGNPEWFDDYTLIIGPRSL